MIQDGYTARWHGTSYEASPAADGTVRLYAPAAAEGFEEVASGRYRRIVTHDELEELRYVRTRCFWQGEPFIIIGEHDDWLRLEYAGGRTEAAGELGLEPTDAGVWQIWTPRDRVEHLHQDLI